MAKPKAIRVTFPLKGLNTALAFDQQPPLTSPSLSNVRPFDPSEERARGGKRPGMIKAYSTQITYGTPTPTGRPIINMVQLVSTYIEPEA